VACIARELVQQLDSAWQRTAAPHAA